MNALRKRGKGFTLLELLIVIVVLAVLAGLALPQYVRTVARTKEGEGWQMMATLRGSLLRYYAEFENYPTDPLTWATLLDVQNPNLITPRYFAYTLASAPGGTFTITGTPDSTAAAGGRNTQNVRTLTLDNVGNKTP